MKGGVGRSVSHTDPCNLALPAAIKHLTGPRRVVVARLSRRGHGAGASQQRKNTRLLELLLNNSSN